MPTPTAKGKSRKWLLYAAGAGVLLALIFLLRKSAPAAEASPGGTVLAPEPLASEGIGSGGGAAAPAAPTLDLGGPLNPGESVSGRSASAGGEVEASRAREAAQNAGATPEQVKSAEEAAYHRGVAIVKKQDKEKAAAAKAKAAAPTKPAPKPQKVKPKPPPVRWSRNPNVRAEQRAAIAHGQNPNRNLKPAVKTAPKPHKTTKRR